MDNFLEIKFGDLKNEERYKKLERNLKLAFIKQKELMRQNDDKGYCTSPTWPSFSTINPDGDTTSAHSGQSLQVSRIDSDIVSSSNNLRKTRKAVSTYKAIPGPRSPMATSSVKQFQLKKADDDRIIMPPPPPCDLNFFNKKQSSKVESSHNNENQQSKKLEIDSRDYDSSTKMSGVSSTVYQNEIVKSDSQDSKGCRIFSRWRVLLNDQGQLIVKGTLQCGKIARSKPIIHRFTNTKLQSLYKHIYLLDGTIVDDRSELPDYIRGKFYNGFPDDWENVHQLWRNFVSEGSKATFRWPTPVTDSDDDLNSEITEFSYCKKKLHSKKQENFSKSIPNNDSSLGYHSKIQSDSKQNLEKSTKEEVDKLNTVVDKQNTNKKTDDSGQFSEVKSTCICNTANCTDNTTKDTHSTSNDCSNSNSKYTSYLYEIIREDKLRIILSNLGDKNCPPQYLDKFIELIDCLRYVLSYTPTNSDETSNKKEDLSSSKIETQICQKCNNTVLDSETHETNVEDHTSNIQNKNKNAKSKDSDNFESEQIKICAQPVSLENKNDILNLSSDSDTCMGIPKISLDRFIESKVPRSERYRDKKNHGKDKRYFKNIQTEEQSKCIQDPQLQECNNSSVITTEDELDKRQLEQKNKNERYNEKLASGISVKNVERKFKTENKQDNFDRDVENLKSKSSSTSNAALTKITNRQKPVIKSCETVCFDLQSKPLSKQKSIIHSDISIVDDEIKDKNNKLSNRNEDEENLGEEYLEHPFLTYDSEDFIDEEEPETQNKLSSNRTENKKSNENTLIKNRNKYSMTETEETQMSVENKKNSSNEKVEKHEPFGSKENPKLLTSWLPCVVYDEQKRTYCLTFEGKLLNEAGHVIHRKFTTDPISQRHSSKLLETIKNEYFILVGEINNTKHVVPKELLKQCRTGCPTKIKEFCEEWKKLKPENNGIDKLVNKQNSSIECLNVPTSSRGRKILPPLNYWDGERTLTKDNCTVYIPGNAQRSTLVTKSESWRRTKTHTFGEQQMEKASDKEAEVRSNKSLTKLSKAESNLCIPERRGKARKRVAQKLKYTSSSESEEDESTKKKNPRNSKQPLREESDNALSNANCFVNMEALTGLEYHSKLRKRKKVDAKENQQNFGAKNYKTMGETGRKSAAALTWTYDKGQYQDILSDDQASVIIK